MSIYIPDINLLKAGYSHEFANELKTSLTGYATDETEIATNTGTNADTIGESLAEKIWELVKERESKLTDKELTDNLGQQSQNIIQKLIQIFLLIGMLC